LVQWTLILPTPLHGSHSFPPKLEPTNSNSEYTGEYFPNGTWYNGQLTTLTNTAGYYLDSAYYQPASTGWQNLTVQSAIISSWPAAALPTGYWSRPVYPENREWASILGNYPPYGIVGGGPNWPANTNTYITHLNYVPTLQDKHSTHRI